MTEYRIFTRTGRELLPGAKVFHNGNVWTVSEAQTHPRKVFMHIADGDPVVQRSSYYADVLDLEIIGPDGVATFPLQTLGKTHPGEECHVIDSATSVESDCMILCNVGGAHLLIYAYPDSSSPQVLRYPWASQAAEQFRLTAAKWAAQR